MKTLIINLIHGVIIGISGLIPGFGMGTCSIILKKYDRFMAMLAHPFKNFHENLKLLVPTLIGIAIGMKMLVGVIEFLLKNYNIQAMYLFLGFALGSLPVVIRQANKKGFKKAYVPILVITTIITFLIVFYINSLQDTRVENLGLSLGSLILYGAIYGFGAVMPSMTTMNILIYLGVWVPIIVGFGALNFEIIIPFGIGYFIIVILAAKFLNYMFENHYGYMYYAILGFAISSLMMLFPGIPTGIDMVTCFTLFAIGFISLYYISGISGNIANSVEKTG